MGKKEKYIHLYETNAEFLADYNGPAYHENWVSLTLENMEVNYNKKLSMTIQELIEGGYAEIKQDSTRMRPGSERSWNIIQIHTNCPVALENIPDFDDYLTSATTFVWREELPSGWNPAALAAKYNEVELARPIMGEMFPCVDLSGVVDLSLSFASGSYQYINSSIVTERVSSEEGYYPGSLFKTPKHLTVTVRGPYSSVGQTNFSMLRTTTGITINCQDLFACHDISGIFEQNPNLEELEINGPWCWDTMILCNLAFDMDHKLKSIPWSRAGSWTRESSRNTIYPHKASNGQGNANCGGLFNASGLEYIGPRINMLAVSLSGCTVDGIAQDPLPYLGKGMFYCPELTDVRIINLNNNDWNFADNTTYTYAPKIDADSIEYLLNNVADCTSNPHTVTFSTLHQNDVSSSAINAAAAKGWTVAWQSV